MHKFHKSAKKYMNIITTRDIQLHLERMGTIQNLHWPWYMFICSMKMFSKGIN